MKSSWCISLFFLLGISVRNTVGHGYVQSPRSRNYRANQLGIEFDYNGLNRKESSNNNYGSGLCGVVANRNYDNFMDGRGWNNEAIYAEGQIINITTHLSAYHGGHFEFGACVVESGIFQNGPNQRCFDNNKLIYLGGGHPVDDIYPHRAYVGLPDVPTAFFMHSFRLPEGLVGDRVLLQWRYFTGNSCKYDGYDEYFESQGWGTGDLPECDFDVDNTGDGPERFWNCVEVTIGAGSGPAPTPSTIQPTPRPTTSPTPTPTLTNPTKKPTTLHPTPTPTVPTPTAPTNPGTCGGGDRGNGVCSDGSCCSQYGWCGNTSAHCSTGEPAARSCCSWNDLGCGGSPWCDRNQSTCESDACAGKWLD